MTSGKISALALLLAALSAAGCCQEQDKTIAELRATNSKLTADNEAFKAQVAAANKSEADALARADDKDVQLANKEMENKSLRDQLNKKTPSATGDGSKTATDWISSTFGDTITLDSDVLFGSGKDTLTATGKQHLDKVARDIKTTYAGRPIRVYGHTDSDPIKRSGWDDNLELSANRAMTVTRYLVKQGVKAAFIETIAMDQYHPRSTKDKAKNRRVEIFAVKSLPGGPPEPKP